MCFVVTCKCSYAFSILKEVFDLVEGDEGQFLIKHPPCLKFLFKPVGCGLLQNK